MQAAPTPGWTVVQQRAEAVFKLLWKRRQLGKMTTALQAIQCGPPVASFPVRWSHSYQPLCGM